MRKNQIETRKYDGYHLQFTDYYKDCISVQRLRRKITNVHAYNVTLLIRNASDGKKYLYDVMGIKMIPSRRTVFSKEKLRGKHEVQPSRKASFPKTVYAKAHRNSTPKRGIMRVRDKGASGEAYKPGNDNPGRRP